MDPKEPVQTPAASPIPASPEVPDTRLFLSIELQNILSFGPKPQNEQEIKLGNLNVIIGPNGSGKSNLIDVLSILTWANRDFSKAFHDGVERWIWKDGTSSSERTANVAFRVFNADRSRSMVHRFSFRSENGAFRLFDELIGTELPRSRTEMDVRYAFSSRTYAKLYSLDRVEKQLPLDDLDLFDPSKSVLSQLRDPQHYPEITYLSKQYERLALYRDYTFGRRAAIHQPQRADQFSDRLEWDASNLGLVVSRLLRDPRTKKRLTEALSDLYDGLDSVGVDVRTGSVEIYFTEGDVSVPATRLSDGSLRYLWLLAILLDPEPPPFIAIEEPELGLHPDLIPKVADLLVDASTRTQLLVTTHSDILIDALSEHPEYVLTCEKHEGQTEIKRLDPDELKVWLKDKGLGNLWLRGHFGGTRW